ncbi:hypothetical protein [Paenibacillus pinistramenti]|uniref:hypothetical protein n=1 Tax=Paenibacillus pinistramenti TaxID=1768003 RepID=UPI001108AFED|nr:hypothetical protein [Paenibacillus pinistramenti]
MNISYQQMPGYQQRPLYQADGPYVQQVKTVKNQLQQICRQHHNQLVKIETMDGEVFIGRIVGCNRGLLQIAVPAHSAPPVPTPYGGAPRALFGYNDMILTLVLYELLVITLLYT